MFASVHLVLPVSCLCNSYIQKSFSRLSVDVCKFLFSSISNGAVSLSVLCFEKAEASHVFLSKK